MARSAERLAAKLLGDSTVRAPFSGVVSRRNISIGEWAAPGMPVLTLVSDGPLRLVMQIAEVDIGAVSLGAAVHLAVPAFPDRTHLGTVTRISPALDAISRTLRVEATMPNETGSLRPGMFGTARIVKPGAAAALVVPRRAVRTEAGVSRVFVAQGGRVQERIVVAGETLGPPAEISAGRGDVEVSGPIAEGERVAASSLDRMADGVAIQVQE